MLANKILAAFAIATISALFGCVSTLDVAIKTANASSAIAQEIHPAVAAMYDEAQAHAVEESKTEEEAVARVAAVRSKYAPYWDAYQAFVASWEALAAAIRLSTELGKDPNAEELMKLAATVQKDQAALVRLAQQYGIAPSGGSN